MNREREVKREVLLDVKKKKTRICWATRLVEEPVGAMYRVGKGGGHDVGKAHGSR